MAMILTQQIINKLVDWQARGNTFSVDNLDRFFVVDAPIEITNAAELLAGAQCEFITIKTPSWHKSVDIDESDFHRDLDDLIMDDQERYYIEHAAKRKLKGVA